MALELLGGVSVVSWLKFGLRNNNGRLGATEQQRLDTLGGSLLHIREDVGIRVERKDGARMSQSLTYHFYVLTVS